MLNYASETVRLVTGEQVLHVTMGRQTVRFYPDGRQLVIDHGLRLAQETPFGVPSPPPARTCRYCKSSCKALERCNACGASA